MGTALPDVAAQMAKQRLQMLQKEAEAVGRQIRIDRTATIKRYYHGAANLLVQGRQCISSQDHERAYTLLMRFATFFLEMIPDHPDHKHESVTKERLRLKSECKVCAWSMALAEHSPCTGMPA